ALRGCAARRGRRAFHHLLLAARAHRRARLELAAAATGRSFQRARPADDEPQVRRRPGPAHGPGEPGPRGRALRGGGRGVCPQARGHRVAALAGGDQGAGLCGARAGLPGGDVRRGCRDGGELRPARLQGRRGAFPREARGPLPRPGARVSATAWPYPRHIAHRGAGRLAPENTIVALDTGWRHGYRMFEFDAKLTADGKVVLMHDDTLERTTDGVGPIATRTWEEVLLLDAGYWHSAAMAGERVPDLDRTADWLIERGAFANIEIKPCRGRDVETGVAV